jgi:NAD(P)-dependent dehydrogenase (short-subunit alcohol dehydrogenase family)
MARHCRCHHSPDVIMAIAEHRPIALVTGAASGIGAATARLIAPRCSQLALHTRGDNETTRGRLATTAGVCRQLGANVLTFTGDLSETGAAAGLARDVIDRFGGLDHLVSNAGYADKRGISELSRADVDRAYAAMTGAFFELAQAAKPALSISKQGRVVFVSSFVAHVYARGRLFPASAAAKAGAEALARSLAAELAPSGVTVNSVVPGYTRKDSGSSALTSDAWRQAADVTPMGHVGEPEDVGQLIAFLLSPAARHITGQSIAVDGGLSLG